jgi:S-DNA-T family DNA segregation ATPase FtsK/SpoIIIE
MTQERLFRLLGVALVVAALFLFASLVTYHSGDPSLNRATSEDVQNFGGATGAALADILLQVTGLASVLVVAAWLAWGWRLARGESQNGREG